MVLEHRAEHASQWAAIVSIATKIGCTAQTLSNWVRQAERDLGRKPGVTTDERERMKALERENRELRQANEILRKASAYFCAGGARPLVEDMTKFIDQYRTGSSRSANCRLVARRMSLTVSSALCGACLSRCLIVSLRGVTMSRKLSLTQSAQSVR